MILLNDVTPNSEATTNRSIVELFYPLDGMLQLIPLQGYPQQYCMSLVPIYTPLWRETIWKKVS